MGFREIQVEARPGDVMAGGGGTAGPAQEIRHQSPGHLQVTGESNGSNGSND